MTEDTRANEAPESLNQAEPMPSSEQTTSEESVPEEAAPSEEVPSEGTTTDDMSLPDGVSDRTSEQFDKLKTQLRDERRKAREYEQYLVQMQQRTQQQPSAEEAKANPLYDPTTGIVDVNELESMRVAATEANKRAEAAEKRFEKYVQDTQEREAYQAYPGLDPDSKDFDQDLHLAARAFLTDSMVNPRDYGGRELTLKEAADRASASQARKMNKAKKEAAIEAVEELTPKEQASLEATGRSDRASETLDHTHDELRHLSRQGSSRAAMDAIVERLKGIPSV